jgi:hypothetical protein
MTRIAVLIGGPRDGDRLVLRGEHPIPLRVQRQKALCVAQVHINDPILPTGDSLTETYFPCRIGLGEAADFVWIHETVPQSTILSRLIEGYRNKG